MRTPARILYEPLGRICRGAGRRRPEKVPYSWFRGVVLPGRQRATAVAVRLFDVNVLVHAFRPDTERHAAFRNWLEEQVNGPEAFGVSELVLSRFIRVLTHPSGFSRFPGLRWRHPLDS